MVFYIFHLVCGVEFGGVPKQGEVDKPDVYRRRRIDVVTASGEVVERAAQIAQGAFLPVAVVIESFFFLEFR